MDDARLVIENILDAERYGATVRNHCKVSGVRALETSGWELDLEDRRTDSAITLEADRVVNATGPWSDQFASCWREENKRFIRPTKGVHLLLPPLRTQLAGFFPSVHDDRLFFVIPWQGKSLLGTTDTDFSGNPDELSVTEEDRTYLLENINSYLDGQQFGKEDIIEEFAGLRPLYAPGEGTESASDVTREHEILEERPGLYSIVGGKYTTYRAIAEETLEVMKAPLRSRTARLAFPGAFKNEKARKRMEDALILGGDFKPGQIGELIERYGSSVVQVLSSGKPFEDGLERVDYTDCLNAQVYHAVLEEHALTVEDVMRRRTGLFMENLDPAEIDAVVNRALDYSGAES